MAPTPPIPAEQPLDAAWKAAGQVVALASAEAVAVQAVAVQAVAVQAVASLTRAALLWPPVPAARAMVGLASALSPWLPPRPLPDQHVVVVMPGSGEAGRGAKVPGGRPGAVRTAAAITLGVEEEFVLLDPSTGAAVLAGPDLVRMLGGEPGVQQKLMRFQVETGTRVCTGLDEAGRELVRLRRLAAAAAARLGCRLVASGVAPYRTPGLAALTCSPVTRSWHAGTARWWPRGPAAATCTSGSPPGTWASRSWPGCGPGLRRCSPSPPTPRSPAGTIPDGPAGGTLSRHAGRPRPRPPGGRRAGYDTAIRGLIGQGAALDERSVYFLARLSPRYPTVEVRIADVCLDAGTAVLLAGLIRALVATALAEARRGTPRRPRRPGRSPRRWPTAARPGSPGQASTRSPGRPSMRRRSAPTRGVGRPVGLPRADPAVPGIRCDRARRRSRRPVAGRRRASQLVSSR